jgi:hypothetical protein
MSRFKDQTRMPNVKEDRREDDHAARRISQSNIKQDRISSRNLHALQPNKRPLIMESLPRISLAQLINPEDTPHKNHQDR